MYKELKRKIYYKFKIGRRLTTIEKLFWTPFKIMNSRETIDYIIENKCSVARFGDGEFSISAYGCGLGFQRADEKLQEELNKVICTKNEKVLLCIPNWINFVKKGQDKDLGPIQKDWC